ncbi:MAG: mannose-1-phosphate guanylyltransferase/mannose-6-phosphate isomerase, partial [Rhodospirillales bacterium]|nr:mannose-1-phosphate guanylyltransferase/mannose-6-phosphate isomerase [Rhodospirillales bacterium]
AAFCRAVECAIPAARDGRFVTFGVVPTHPETGYGYIRAGRDLGAVRPIAAFVEKPDAAKAAAFVASGDYLWNSGMFLLPARGYLDELRRLDPAMHSACEKSFASAARDLDFIRLERAAFEACRSDSIDYAVMEHTDAGAVVPVDIGWDDLGSWTAMWRVAAKDADGNVTVGDVVAEDVRNSYLRSDGPLLAAIGLDDVFVIATDDAVLVVSRDSVECVRTLIERMMADGRTEHLSQPRVYRPWGWYQTLDVGDRFQVKHLMVKAGGRLSLQAHRHRAEQWVVVSGTARVTRGDEIITLGENESVYLAAGVRHRLENTTKNPLRVIEVQSGRYLGEDDIVRFDDDYGRR